MAIPDIPNIQRLHSPFDSPRTLYHNHLFASADGSNAATHFY